MATIRLVHTDDLDVGMSEYEEHEARTLRTGSTRRGAAAGIRLWLVAVRAAPPDRTGAGCRLIDQRVVGGAFLAQFRCKRELPGRGLTRLPGPTPPRSQETAGPAVDSGLGGGVSSNGDGRSLFASVLVWDLASPPRSACRNRVGRCRAGDRRQGARPSGASADPPDPVRAAGLLVRRAGGRTPSRPVDSLRAPAHPARGRSRPGRDRRSPGLLLREAGPAAPVHRTCPGACEYSRLLSVGGGSTMTRCSNQLEVTR